MGKDLYIRYEELSEKEKTTCRRGLEKVRKLLANPKNINCLVKKGVKEIPIWNPRGFYGDLNAHKTFMGVLLGRFESFFWKYDKSPEVYNPDLLRKALNFLANALNDPKMFEDLVNIGTRGFLMPWACDFKPNTNADLIGIHNHVGCLFPNFDYSITEEGILWHHG